MSPAGPSDRRRITGREKEGWHMLPREQKRAFGAFYRSARQNDVLEPKTTLMLHLATAMAVGCVP